MIPLLLALGCGRLLEDEAQLLLDMSGQATFQTVATLGPHRTEISVARSVAGVDRVSVEGTELAWGDWDNFHLRRTRDGRVVTESIVSEGAVWTRSGSGAFQFYEDAGLTRGELAFTWEVWNQALVPFGEAIVLTHEGETVVEGRPAEAWTVSLGPLPEQPARSDLPLELSGRLVVDKATAVRLLAEVEGRYLQDGRQDKERSVAVRVARSQIGEIPEISPP